MKPIYIKRWRKWTGLIQKSAENSRRSPCRDGFMHGDRSPAWEQSGRLGTSRKVAQTPSTFPVWVMLSRTNDQLEKFIWNKRSPGFTKPVVASLLERHNLIRPRVKRSLKTGATVNATLQNGIKKESNLTHYFLRICYEHARRKPAFSCQAASVPNGQSEPPFPEKVFH